MKNLVEVALWGDDFYDRSVIEPIEEMCGHKLGEGYEELFVSTYERCGRECGILGEIFISEKEDFFFAWVEWMNLYRGFDTECKAREWVERMAAYEFNDEWPEEIPNYEVLKTIQRLQGAN